MFNPESRESIIELAKGSIPPDHADGAVLFYSKDARTFEVYKMAEGKFCSMFGEVLETLPEPQVAASDDVEEVYRLDSRTGTVVRSQRLRVARPRLKRGHEVDPVSGKILRREDGAEVDLSEAVEVVRPPATRSLAEQIAERQQK